MKLHLKLDGLKLKLLIKWLVEEPFRLIKATYEEAQEFEGFQVEEQA